jgi:hypothetical protein
MELDSPQAAEEMIWQYRCAHETGDTTTAAALRKAWADFDGEDSLHECAFGEPISDADAANRKLVLIERLRQTESELKWLGAAETVPQAGDDRPVEVRLGFQ